MQNIFNICTVFVATLVFGGILGSLKTKEHQKPYRYYSIQTNQIENVPSTISISDKTIYYISQS